MRKIVFSILTLAIIGFSSCKKACQQTVTEPISTITLLDTMTLGDQQDISIEYSFGDCTGDETHTMTVDETTDFDYEIKMEVLYTGCTCNYILIYGEKNYNFEPTEIGTYTFNFWKNDTEKLTKTIVVQ